MVAHHSILVHALQQRHAAAAEVERLSSILALENAGIADARTEKRETLQLLKAERDQLQHHRQEKMQLETALHFLQSSKNELSNSCDVLRKDAELLQQQVVGHRNAVAEAIDNENAAMRKVKDVICKIQELKTIG